MKSNIYFASSNEDKIREAEAVLGISLKTVDLDLDELQTIDLNNLVRHKAQQAYALLKTPVLVEDTSLYFDAWNGLPGPFIKWFLKSMGTDALVDALAPFENKGAEAVCCVGYADERGIELFIGKLKGLIVPSRGDWGFGWDPIFQPEGKTQTFGEMPLEEKLELSMRRTALQHVEAFLSQQS